MHFVDDVDLIARRYRAVANLFDNLSDVIDTGMRGGVHFDDVDMAAIHDRLAVFARHTKVDRRPVGLSGLVVQRTGEDAGGGGLADPAHTGQHIGLRDATRFKSVGERAHHRFLADHQVGEILGAILARQNTVGGRFLNG
ncbi:hypothetical protein D9M72_528140 [compost metagenome]